MKSIEMRGKTVDEAIKKALEELKVNKEQVEIEIIEKGSKGFLNLIGTKDAIVKITVKKNHEAEAKEFLSKILKKMKIEAEVQTVDQGETLNVNIIGDNMGILIGYRGETLDSLQYLVSLVVNRDNDEKYKRVILDTQNYRAKREETLRRLAMKVAKKVKIYNKSIKLEPMNPYERRIIHASLQEDNYVRTHSEGDEPYRRVVVELKRKKA